MSAGSFRMGDHPTGTAGKQYGVSEDLCPEVEYPTSPIVRVKCCVAASYRDSERLRCGLISVASHYGMSSSVPTLAEGHFATKPPTTAC